MITVSLKMPKRLALEVTAAARRRGVSRSALIREAIEVLLAQEEPEQPLSALALVADLAGSCDGPADLPTSRSTCGAKEK